MRGRLYKCSYPTSGDDEDEHEGAKIYLGGLDHSDRQSRGAEVGVDE
jgi:hypothetical protein